MASQNFPEFCLHEIQLIHMKTSSNDGRCGIVQISVNGVVSRTLGKDKICQLAIPRVTENRWESSGNICWLLYSNM